MAAALGSVFVTGANRGLGFELVKQLSANPSNSIFAGCRNPSGAKELDELSKKNTNVTVLKLDVSNDDNISEVVKAVGEKQGFLNVLFNVAAIYEGKSLGLADQSRDMLQRHFDVNTTSAIMMAKAFRELLLGGKGKVNKPSVIANFTSEMGSIKNASSKSFPYRCSKTAVNMASKCIGNELGSEGVYCIAVHPGWCLTDMGGPNALITAETSVTGIIKVVSEITEDQNGKFLDYMGKFREY